MKVSISIVVLAVAVAPTGGYGVTGVGRQTDGSVLRALRLPLAQAATTPAFVPAPALAPAPDFTPAARAATRTDIRVRKQPPSPSGSPRHAVPVAAQPALVSRREPDDLDLLPAVAQIEPVANAITRKVDVKAELAPAVAQRIEKTAVEKAQDAWEARRTLAYLDTIPAQNFSYVHVSEAAPGEHVLMAVAAGRASPAAAPPASENNDKSQSPSVAMEGVGEEAQTK